MNYFVKNNVTKPRQTNDLKVESVMKVFRFNFDTNNLGRGERKQCK